MILAPRRQADASRTARLACRAIRGDRLQHESHASADHAQCRLAGAPVAHPTLPIRTTAGSRIHAPPPDRRGTARQPAGRLGQLDLTPAEGHPFPPEASWNFTQHDPFNAVYETNHRTAFLMVQRQRRHPFLSLFDGADPNASTPGRQATTVPTQALYFINDPFFHVQGEKFAAGLMPLADDDARITHACRMLFQRQPSAAERERWKKFLAAYPGSAAEAQGCLCPRLPGQQRIPSH